MFKISKRLERLPPYLFVEIDRAKRKAREKGRLLVDLGVGDPDKSPPKQVIDAMCQALKLEGIHRYSLDQGLEELRKEISFWYKERFQVDLAADKEILPLIGSKEGLVHFPLAILNAGDFAVIPDPAYPAYQAGIVLAGAKPYRIPLREEDDFLPQLKKIPYSVRKKTKLIFVNYPNNPTSAIAPQEFYRELVDFAYKNKIIIVSDLAYSEITYDGYRSNSILEIEGAKEVAIEFHSLSKTYSMTGWRIGWACGNERLVGALLKVKSNIDSGIFMAIQKAGVVALRDCRDYIKKICKLYKERRDILVEGLRRLGFEFKIPKATFYLWVKIPKGFDSIRFARTLLEKAGVVVTPGRGFGRYGEGFVRFALTVDKERIEDALRRIKKFLR